MRVLVGYGSRFGTTQEVAEAIARKLRGAGDDAECRDAADVHEVDGFDAVIVGSGLYAGRMRLRARRLMRAAAKAGIPLPVFALGPLEDVEEQWFGAREQLDQEIARVKDAEPVAITVFGGCLDPDGKHFPFSRMSKSDLRDWSAIDEWALHARAQLAARTTVVH